MDVCVNRIGTVYSILKDREIFLAGMEPDLAFEPLPKLRQASIIVFIDNPHLAHENDGGALGHDNPSIRSLETLAHALMPSVTSRGKSSPKLS